MAAGDEMLAGDLGELAVGDEGDPVTALDDFAIPFVAIVAGELCLSERSLAEDE